MKIKKIGNILKFVDKNIKFKSKFRGKKNNSTLKSQPGNKNRSKTAKYRNQNVKPNPALAVDKHADGFIKLKCSPKIQDNDFTCYSNESLIKLKNLWNARHPDVKITSSSPKEIHPHLYQ